MSVLFLHHPKETDLALFAGGELGPLARWRIERHVQTCAECEDAVADFFHLQGDVSELAELPPIDWAALSLSVREAVAEAHGKPEPARGRLWQRPLVWQAGLVSAVLFCTIVVLDRYSSTPEATVATRFPLEQHQTASTQAGAKSALTEPDGLSAAYRELAPEAPFSAPRQDNDSLAEPASPLAAVGSSSRSAFSTPDGQLQSAVPPSGDSASPEPKERDAADERKSIEGAELARAVDSVLPGDVGARSTPGRPVAQSGLAQPAAGSAVGGEAAAEKAEESQSNTLAFARRNAPQAVPPPASQSASNERQAVAESFRGRAGQQAQSGAAAPSALRAEMKVAPEAEALADRGAGQAVTPSVSVERGSGEIRQSIAPSSGPGFSVPPGGLRVDTAVAADGGISFRSVDSRTGTITIYDVYAP